MTALAIGCVGIALLCVPGPAGAARLGDIAPRDAHAAPPSRSARPVTTAVLAGAALIGFLVAGPGGGVAAVVGAGTVRRRRSAGRAAGDAAAIATEVADALRRITGELRSGAHPAVALGGVRSDGARAQQVLADAAAAAQLGDDVGRALRREAGLRPVVAVDLLRLADTWSLAERHGIPLADLLDDARRTIGWRVQFGRRVHAQLAGPRATAAVLAALPAVGLLLGQLLGADPVGVLRSSVLGQLLLVVGAGLTAAGFAWCDRILCAAVPQ